MTPRVFITLKPLDTGIEGKTLRIPHETVRPISTLASVLRMQEEFETRRRRRDRPRSTKGKERTDR